MAEVKTVVTPRLESEPRARAVTGRVEGARAGLSRARTAWITEGRGPFSKLRASLLAVRGMSPTAPAQKGIESLAKAGAPAPADRSPASAGPVRPAEGSGGAARLPISERAAPQPSRPATEVHPAAPRPVVPPPESGQATTEQQTAAIKAERAKLAEGEGIAIGGQSFKLPEAADQDTARKVFANGIGALIDSNVDALLIRYAIAQAQLAGISGDQLRIDLDRQLTEEKPIPPGPDGEPRIVRVPKDNYIRELGLPERKVNPEDASIVTPDDRGRAEQTKKDLLVDIIKAGKHIGLPERDITEAAEKLVNEKLQPKTTRKKDVQKAQEIKGSLMKANTETLTVIIAHPEILSDAHKQEVASLIRDKMKYVEKHWWRLNRKRKDEAITNEQIKAFMATPEQLNALEEKYKKAEPKLLTWLKLVFGLAVTTFFDLATDELEDNVMGQKYLR